MQQRPQHTQLDHKAKTKAHASSMPTNYRDYNARVATNPQSTTPIPLLRPHYICTGKLSMVGLNKAGTNASTRSEPV